MLDNKTLNNLHTEYFKVMDITEEQKLERIELAELLDDVFLFLFMYLDSMTIANTFDIDDYKEMASRRYKDALTEYGIDFNKYPNVEKYADRMLDKIIDSTIRNATATTTSSKNSDTDNVYPLDDSTSREKLNTADKIQERAVNVAQNEANSIFNRMEYDDAVNSGYTTKTWITEGDDRVRATHMEVDMETIPIDQHFQVGKSLMLFPRDDNCIDNEAKEIVNCRCSILYS